MMRQRSDVAREAASGFHSLWPIGEHSFEILARARLPAHSHCRSTSTLCPAQLADGSNSSQLLERSRAIDIASPPHLVWPWLAQLMRGAGIYGATELETPECRSSSSLLIDLPPPRLDDRVGGVFRLVVAEPACELAWRSEPNMHVLGFPVRITIAYRLTSLAERRTRFTASVVTHKQELTEPIRDHLVQIVDTVLIAPQLERLKQLAERSAHPTSENAHPLRFQAAKFRPAPVEKPRATST